MLLANKKKMAQIYKCTKCGGEISYDRTQQNDSVCLNCEQTTFD